METKAIEHTPRVLTVTGSDGMGEAGIQSDIQTIREIGATPLSAITTITVQNTLGIQQLIDLPPTTLGLQLEAIMDDIRPQAIKIGILRSSAQVMTMVDIIKRYKPQWVVYDPVQTTTRGDELLTDALKAEINTTLEPLCSVVTSYIKVESLVDWDHHGIRGVFATAIATYLALGYERQKAIDEAAAYAGRRAALMADLEGRGAELYNELLRLITKHHKEHADVGFYARQMNVSTRYLAQVTRRMANVSPKQLIEEYLLRQLKQTLLLGNYTVQEVAYRYGFNSQSHFTKFFKKMTGETPTQYKYSKKN